MKSYLAIAVPERAPRARILAALGAESHDLGMQSGLLEQTG